jgi:hypothetical protein
MAEHLQRLRHIVILNDDNFQCPCPECVTTHLSLKFRAAHRLKI